MGAGPALSPFLYMKKTLLFGLLAILFYNCKKEDPPVEPGLLQLTSIRIGTTDLNAQQAPEDVPVNKGIIISFALPLNTETAGNHIKLEKAPGEAVPLTFSFLDGDKTISVSFSGELEHFTSYKIIIGEVAAKTGEVFPGATYQFKTLKDIFILESVTLNGRNLMTTGRVFDVAPDMTLEATFSDSLTAGLVLADFLRIGGLDLSYQLSTDQKTVQIKTVTPGAYLKKYNFIVGKDLISKNNKAFEGFTREFYTRLDSTYKFPVITDDELLTKVQSQTFKYFWDFGHPVSGLARERNTTGETVTTGGSGFGIMAILAAIQRGFITRQEGIDRIFTITGFLKTADRFHGVWPHWLNGTTGKVIPFSPDDDGADLVETAFLMQGLLTVRSYLDTTVVTEKELSATITQLWEEVEWDWFTQGGQDVLYWHWSPNVGWQKNHKIQGWNEALIVYVLAAASPTHSINQTVYTNGWARGGAMQNGRTFFSYPLPLGPNMGGPLFFSHYSFLGLDPRNLKDQYADYWTQNVNHALINRAYCIDNPSNFVGYGPQCWGLTASDNESGYSAHAPDNDKGVITPTAALSSFPYTPTESMGALHHFYYLLGDWLWGPYGFYDAFNLTAQWTAGSSLAIDQGPIIVMIENYRTGLLWDLFMANPEIAAGLDKLGFTSY